MALVDGSVRSCIAVGTATVGSAGVGIIRFGMNVNIDAGERRQSRAYGFARHLKAKTPRAGGRQLAAAWYVPQRYEPVSSVAVSRAKTIVTAQLGGGSGSEKRESSFDMISNDAMVYRSCLALDDCLLPSFFFIIVAEKRYQ